MNEGLKVELRDYLGAPHQADILIVDDTIENLWLLTNILEEQGYEVRKAISGSSALMAVQAAIPDLILLDICMPDMDGYTLCQQIKSIPESADVPVIFLSALHEALDKVKAFSIGGADYITKPFQAAEVLVRTRNQLMIRQAMKAVQHMNLRLESQIQERTRALEIANQRLMEIAYYDNLTGLPNRALFTECLARSLEAVQADPDYRFAVLFVDCDRFKLINDSFGHLVGDEVLAKIAQRLATVLNSDDVLARFGGDEFVILLRQVDNTKAAIAVADRLIEAMKPSIPLPHLEVFITTSIGIVISNPIDHQKSEHILRDADIAMYSAKANGKDRYCVFTPMMQRASLERFQVETDLHRALDQAEFVPFYQPIVNLKTGEVVGLEVLIRWQHPERGLILPHAFISVAEETGLIIPIGKALLDQACRHFAEWRSHQVVDDQFFISFNLSACQIAQASLPQCLQHTLAQHQLSPHHLRLEITETTLLNNSLAIAVITQLAQQGMHLCIDDFGIGYSSLSYLHQFPVKTVKIDRSFIQSIASEPYKLQIVKAILGIVDALNMTAVAEGIETREQLMSLEKMNCELGQGYLFSKPVSADITTHLLKTQIQCLQ